MKMSKILNKITKKEENELPDPPKPEKYTDIPETPILGEEKKMQQIPLYTHYNEIDDIKMTLLQQIVETNKKINDTNIYVYKELKKMNEFFEKQV